MTLAISHRPEAQCFEATVEGTRCVLDYTFVDGGMVIVHTGVPPAVAGRGIAGALVRAALEFAHQKGWQVRPECSYAAAWMDRHSEFDALRMN